MGLCKLNICGSVYTDYRPTLTEIPVLLKEILATVRYFSSEDSTISSYISTIKISSSANKFPVQEIQTMVD